MVLLIKKSSKKENWEVDSKQNSFWMNNIYDAFFYGTNLKEILEKHKMTDALTAKMIQDAAKNIST